MCLGYLSDSQKEGLISLLLKQEFSGQYKDPVNLKKPIRLQCYDTKILANCRAQRVMKRVRKSIIHPDQCAFLQSLTY